MRIKHKLLSGAMAGAMALSLAVPAFAASQTVITSTYTEPAIAVIVPQTGTAAINPYGLPINITATVAGKNADGTADVAKGDKIATLSGQQITTMPLAIISNTTVALDVKATVTGVVKSGSDLKLVEDAEAFAGLATDGTAVKSAFMYLQAKDAALDYATDGVLIKDAKGNVTKCGEAALAKVFEDWEASDYTAGTEDAPAGDVIVKAKGATPTLIGTLGAATDVDAVPADPDNGTDAVYAHVQTAADGVLAIRLAGKVTETAKTAWSVKDVVTTTVAFTFTPATTNENDGG